MSETLLTLQAERGGVRSFKFYTVTAHLINFIVTCLTIVDQGHKGILLVRSDCDGIDHVCGCGQALQEYMKSLWVSTPTCTSGKTMHLWFQHRHMTWRSAMTWKIYLYVSCLHSSSTTKGQRVLD